MSEFGAPERKFHRPEAGLVVSEGHVVEGYASLFGKTDQGGDVVQKGAYAASLKRLGVRGGRVKMLWQHDPGQPIGVWDEVKEDAAGLWVKGRILTEVEKGREVAALVQAGAIDGLSIGYRTVRAERDGKGQRLLSELELWEVSLVTFPMLPEARVAAKAEALDDGWRHIAAVFEDARRSLADHRTG
ncbi:HK97 family phage prohead protease [Tabrizicola sp.]|jgi:HK97 family phage prohead protease|uniref:HK97 family phage prohead protease n=1 Tax=Tabrizicola sp. TaxID=2005166 RepID=UPI0035B180EE